jgi:aspartyl/asparaginyl beta-hydroxylase (cupin superfamily)
VTGPDRQAGRGAAGGARALGRLLLGHLSQFRDARLQDLATGTLREPAGSRWVIPAVNLTLRARQALTRAAYLEPRRELSRARFAIRRRGQAPPVPGGQLSLLCPTRERPGGLAALLRSLDRTAYAGQRIEVLCYADADDPLLPGYRRLFDRAGRDFPRLGRCALIVGEPVGVPAAWNELAAAAAGDYLLMANDDQLYVDYAWDLALDDAAARLRESCPDQVLCLYFDGGQYGRDVPDFPIISRAWYEALGYFAPVIFQQWSTDKWIFDIARQAGRLYPVPGVFVEHRHYQEYKAPFDATYQRHRMTREKSLADQTLFLRTKQERAQEAATLQRVISRHAAPAQNPPDGTPDGSRDMTGLQEDGGTQGYITQMVRRYFGNLIDAWHYAGRPDVARECADLAVRQGVWTDPLQRAREYIPGLTAQPVHDPSQFWFTGYLEEQYPLIRAELDQVLGSAADPVRPTVDDAALIRRGAWQQAHLFRDGRWQDEVCAQFPVLTAIVREIPEVSTFNPGVIAISRVGPGTHINAHCGPTNAVLRIHLPITVPPGGSIRVGQQEMTWAEGKCLVFDDSFEHEVHYEGAADRVVLILDVLHPELGGDHRERLLQRRLTFEEQIVAFMKEHGLERIATQDGQLVLYPDAATRDVAGLYMSATGITGAELDGDKVTWQRRPEGG